MIATSQRQSRWTPWWIGGLLVAGLAAASAEPEITWYLYDLPPYTIVEGAHKGEGMYDLALRRHLIPALPGYQHKTVVVPIQRRDALLKSEPAACGIGLLKNPDRARYMTFSVPYQALIPPGLFIRRADAGRVTPFLDGAGKLSLTKLLAQGGMTVGVDSARSNGATIDGLLKPYQGKPNLFSLTTPDASKSVFQMVANERIDATLGFPYEAVFLGLELSGSAKGLRFYPLAEQPDYLYVYAACAQSEFGETAIRKINVVLQQPAVLNAIHDYYEQWLDEDARKLARQLRERAFSGMARP